MARIPGQHCKKGGTLCNSTGSGISGSHLSTKKSVSGFLLTSIIAILPKCPMCALAYSTAITMCSGKAFEHSADWSSYISISLAFLTMVVVLWNFKGLKTIAAALIIVAGGAMICVAELFSGNVANYYIGCAAVLAGVWLNGSLLHFIRKWTGSGRGKKSIIPVANGAG